MAGHGVAVNGTGDHSKAEGAERTQGVCYGASFRGNRFRAETTVIDSPRRLAEYPSPKQATGLRERERRRRGGAGGSGRSAPPRGPGGPAESRRVRGRHRDGARPSSSTSG